MVIQKKSISVELLFIVLHFSEKNKRKAEGSMTQYLWEFSFEELFFAENGKEIIDEATPEELKAIHQLQAFYNETASACKRSIQKADKADLINQIPNLMYFDVKLQLCLIYSISIAENSIITKSWRKLLEGEAAHYFYEYRCFRQTYHFEQYSLLNQIALVN